MDSELADPRRWWALAALSMAVLIVAIDVTVLNVALPQLSESLQPTGVQTLWIADCYSFVLASLLVTMGSLGDRWGRKRLLLVGCVAFAGLSVAAAFAPSAGALIAARAAMGVAGATLMPATLALIRNTFRVPHERTVAIGIWSAMAAAGEAIGPIVAGILLEHFWWGSVFLVNIPVCLLVVAIGWFALRESRNPNPGPLDGLSVISSVVGLLAAVGAIKGIAANGVDDGAAWALAVLGCVALAWFVRRQMRLPIPMIDMRLFRRPAFTGAVVADVVSIFGLAGMLFYLSLQFQFVDGFSPLATGLHLLPAMGGAVISAPTTGYLVRLTSRRTVVSGALFLAALGAVGLAPALDGSMTLEVVSLALIGLGAGWSFTATAEAIMLSSPPSRAGAASAVSETAYELGSALGIAILGTVLSLSYRLTLSLPAGLPGSVQAPAEDSISSALHAASRLPPALGDQVAEAARSSFGHAVLVTTLVTACFLFAGACLARLLLPPTDPLPVERADPDIRRELS